MSNNQEVYLSKSKSGKCGFFTGNFMASPISPTEYEKYSKDPAAAKLAAQKLGFVLKIKFKKLNLISTIKENLIHLLMMKVKLLKLNQQKS